jgi:hypothetical protein
MSDINENIEHDLKMKKIKEDVLKSFSEYRNTITFMAADAPIAILCLPAVIENALLNHGCLRVYDLLNLDFTKVKGLGIARIRHLTTSLDEFFSML